MLAMLYITDAQCSQQPRLSVRLLYITSTVLCYRSQQPRLDVRSAVFHYLSLTFPSGLHWHSVRDRSKHNKRFNLSFRFFRSFAFFEVAPSLLD